jgi:beta-glucosidase
MGQEHKGKGVTVQLGPVAGPIGRSPEGGRNWEGFSPDPVLTGIANAQTIQGIQDAGVVACVKHLVGNEQGEPLSLTRWIEPQTTKKQFAD